jgi:hypothetical protein
MILSTTDLAARTFHPQRPRLDAARAEIAEVTDPRAAWLKLAGTGIVPTAFAAGTRRFAATHDVALAPNTTEVLAGEVLDHPPTIAAVLTHAADPEGMLAAESALSGLYQRLAAWGAEAPSRLLWLCAPKNHPHAVTLNGAYVTALDSLDASLEEAGHALADWMPPEELGLPHIARRAVAADAGWRVAATKSLTVSRACWPPELLAGKRFMDLQNPFESLLRLWSTGYLLDVGEGRDDVWLVAPEI